MLVVLLSSAVKLGTHFLENNKITAVFTMLKLCVSKEHWRSNATCNVERDATWAIKTKPVYLFFHWDDAEIGHFKPPSINDVTKIKDTFYLEWPSKSCSLSSYILVYEYSGRFHRVLWHWRGPVSLGHWWVKRTIAVCYNLVKEINRMN